MENFSLMKHQKQLIDRAQFERDLFLAWGLGTGKTCATIQIIRGLCMEEQRIRKTLVLAPSAVLSNWKEEFQKFSKIDKEVIKVLNGTRKQRVETIKKSSPGSIFVTNYASMQMQEVVNAFLEFCPEILVCDESHFLKSHSSKRSKNTAKIADLAEHRYLLSGTPILKDAMDVFMQFRILDGYQKRKSTFGTNFFVFRNRYFKDENEAWKSSPKYYPRWVPKPKTYKELQKKIDSKMSKVTKEECLDLPPLVKTERRVELSSEQKKYYNDMKKYFITYLKELKESDESSAVVARLAVTKALRLQQIIAGFLKDEDGNIHRIEDNPRLQELETVLQELTMQGNKVIVWTVFSETYKMIAEVCERIGVGYAELHGEITSKKKQKNIDLFNKEKDCSVLIANPAAGGVGVNLTSSSYSVYYTRSFRLGDDIQSESRNHRKGSEHFDKITRINFVASGTIDELVSETLNQKKEVSDYIMDWHSKL